MTTIDDGKDTARVSSGIQTKLNWPAMMPRNMHRASLPTPSLLDDYRLSFDHLTRMRVLINLHLAGLACVSFRRRCNRTKVGSRVKQVDHVLQAIAIFCAKM